MNKFLANLDSEQEEEQVEYRQETDPKKIKAILKAKQISKAHEESILKVLEQQPTPEPKRVPQKKDKPKFIQDDRERTAVLQQTYAGKQKEKQPLKEQPKGKDNKQKEQGKVKGKQEKGQRKDFGQRAEDYITTGHDARRKQSEQVKQSTAKKTQYRQKQTYAQKKNQGHDNREQKRNNDQGEKKRNIQGQKKYYREKQQRTQDNRQTGTVKPKRQTYTASNGVQMQLVLTRDQGQLQNQIYIGKREVQIYLSKAKDKLQNHDFIVLKSFGIYVSKTFLIAGLLADEYSSLKQINIPGTVEVRAYTDNGNKLKSRGSIRIELSLHKLDKNNIGYQESGIHAKKGKTQFKEKQSYRDTEERNPKYKQKQPQKRPLYQQKRQQPRRGGKHRQRGAQKKLQGSDEERALR